MNEITILLKELKMPGMARYWTSLEETRRSDTLSLRDGLMLLIQAERDNRLLRRNARLVKNARFRYGAIMEEVIPDSARGLDKSVLADMSTCTYIHKGLPVLITGPAGTGKSWLGSALGHKACTEGYKVAYFNILRLFEDIALARVSCTQDRLFNKLAQTDLLILDDFGIMALDGQQMLDFMRIMEDRHGRKSTVIISQLPVANWYDVLKKNTTAADALLDRIVHTAIRFELKGESMRRKKQVEPTETTKTKRNLKSNH